MLWLSDGRWFRVGVAQRFPKLKSLSEADKPVGVKRKDETGGPSEAGVPTEAGETAEAGRLVAEAGGGPLPGQETENWPKPLV